MLFFYDSFNYQNEQCWAPNQITDFLLTAFLLQTSLDYQILFLIKNSHPEVLKHSSEFTRKHLCQSLFSNKVAGLSACNFIKTGASVFCEFWEIFRDTFFIKHLRWLLLLIFIPDNFFFENASPYVLYYFLIFLLIKVFVTNKKLWKVCIISIKSMFEVQTLDFLIELTPLPLCFILFPLFFSSLKFLLPIK